MNRWNRRSRIWKKCNELDEFILSIDIVEKRVNYNEYSLLTNMSSPETSKGIVIYSI